MEHIEGSRSKVAQYSPEIVQAIRKEYNFEKEERLEESYNIILQWIKQQDHILKKDFSKRYLERCLVTCKGSLERVKVQIDKMCTMRTLMPQYFETTNVLESDLMTVFEKGYLSIVPQLTKDLYRIIILKTKPDAQMKQSDYTNFYKYSIIMAEYLKSNDYCRGYIVLVDYYDSNAARVLAGINLAELQQIIPIITVGYGTKLKGLIYVTASKFIEGFVKLLKPLFSEKIGSRIHVSSTKQGVSEYFNGADVLPREYGGKEEKTVEVLNDELLETLASTETQELLREMKKARTDETKIHRDQFNAQEMGMPGTFRTLNLD